jgi:hypothetical protein
LTKDGNRNRFGFKGSSSFLTGKVLVEGPLPEGSFMITARKNYSDKILKKFLNDKNAPVDFYDFSFKLNTINPLIDNGKFSIFAFSSYDKLNNRDPSRENFEWANSLIGFEWLQIYDVPLILTLGISLSNFDGKLIPNLSSLKPRENNLNDFSFNTDFTYVFNSKDELSAGLNFKIIDTDLFLVNKVEALTEISDRAGNFYLYGKYKFLRFENFGLDIGTRYNVSGLTDQGGSTFEPRVNLTYRILPELALKGAWGIFQQELTALTDESEVISLFEPWIIIPDYLKPEKAIHYIGGLDFDPYNFLKISVEGYYKIIQNLPVINDKKFTSADPDLIEGKGQSYGWELMFNYNYYPVNVRASYSLSWSYKEVADYLYYPRYDTRHTASLSLDYDFGSGWNASAVWFFNSGLPYTQLAGFYDKYYMNDLFSSWFLNGMIQPFTILGDKNLGRLPQYHRLDLSLSKELSVSVLNLVLDVSLINVYNRENIFYFERQTGKRVNMLPFLPTATIKVEI